MAVAIVADAGSATANSYVTLAAAETFMEGRLNGSLWDAATTDSKNRALVEATRELTNKTYLGQRASSTQTLAWPRQWTIDPDSPFGWFFDSTVIPQRIKDATCELAFQFIKAGTTDVAALDATAGVRIKTVDVLTTEYEPNLRPQGLKRYPRVWAYIAPLLGASGATVPVIRG